MKKLKDRCAGYRAVVPVRSLRGLDSVLLHREIRRAPRMGAVKKENNYGI